MFLVSPSTKMVSPGINLVSGAKFRFILPSRLIAIILIPCFYAHPLRQPSFLSIFGHRNFNNSVIAVKLYVIEDMVGGIADSRPIGKLPFGIYDFIRPVSQKEFCVHIPCRTGNYLLASNSFNRDVVSSEL